MATKFKIITDSTLGKHFDDLNESRLPGIDVGEFDAANETDFPEGSMPADTWTVVSDGTVHGVELKTGDKIKAIVTDAAIDSFDGWQLLLKEDIAKNRVIPDNGTDKLGYMLTSTAEQGVFKWGKSPLAVKVIYTATDGQTEFIIPNTIGRPLTVMIEGYPIAETEYDRDENKITLHTGADENEQVYIIAHNG